MVEDTAQSGTEPTVDAPAKPNGANKPAKRPRKAAVKATGKAKPVKAKAAKGAAKPRQRDPSRLDQFGLRKGSNKSKAAALYSRGKGATLAEVRDAVGSTQFNVLTELNGKGYKVEKSQAKGLRRPITRYRLVPKK